MSNFDTIAYAQFLRTNYVTPEEIEEINKIGRENFRKNPKWLLAYIREERKSFTKHQEEEKVKK